MEFKKVLSKTLAAMVLGSALLTNACFKQDIQKDSTKLNSYLLDKKDLQFESKEIKEFYESVTYTYGDDSSKRIRYVEIYKDKKLYGIINNGTYYFDKDRDNIIDLKCGIDKITIKCDFLTGNPYENEGIIEDIAFPKE